MIGFDRPLRPHWIYESLLLAKPGQKLSELTLPFEDIACELTGKEGKRKVRTVLFRCFIRDPNNRYCVRKNLELKKLSEKYDPEFMKPIYLMYLIGNTDTLIKISRHIFRLYDFGDTINQTLLKEKMVDSFGERDIVTRALRSFVQTLEHFGIVERSDNGVLLKQKLTINEEQMQIMFQLFAKEIHHTPQVSLNHLPKSIFNYFQGPDVKEVAQKYNGVYWDYQHRMSDDYLMMF
ncbi:hypothetical protein [Methanogenium cariaci]|uniref:hypothetical protein n=1 Tax=Methanogenium cariaci TaxID=2197 RepID=UPI000783DF3D|nr:hypothetical protein [Methanogenium cariaci]